MGKCLFTMGYSFKNDYSEGAHPRVLEALTRTNAEQTDGYGTDDYCARARERVRTLCNAPKADVHFLVGEKGNAGDCSGRRARRCRRRLRFRQ